MPEFKCLNFKWLIFSLCADHHVLRHNGAGLHQTETVPGNKKL